MVRNMKIKNLLILSFALILAIMGVLGGCASFFTQMLANQSISFYENPHTVQLEIAEVRLTMAEIGSKIKEAIINKTDESTKETTAYIATGLETMNAHITVVKERFLGEKSLLDTADAQVAVWLGTIEQLRVMMEAGQYGKAVEYFNADYLKAETAMEEACIKISEDSGVRTLAVYEQAKKSKIASTIAISVMIAAAIIMTIIVCGRILRSILTPLRKIQASSDALSKGQLHQQVDFSGTNEFGQLAASMNNTIDTLATYVDNIDEALDRMSNNDMTVTIDLDYVGDFASIKTSMQQIAAALNKALHQIYICSDQVANSSEMLSAGAQNLSQGASEQSSSVEELSAGVTEISVQVTQNASYSNEARQLVEKVGAELESGNQKMGQMLGAISEINNASDQIAKIIKTIEDIAFQTNILALNAAVEAARAGEAGKGFAVVADEVRNLASKSSEAAKSTTALIQNSIHAVENGTNIADDTAATLKSVVSGAERITQMISHIAEASETQANSLSQVTSSINQISQVIQTNSATAEESAAASEEMSSQSRILESLVRKFKLLNN